MAEYGPRDSNPAYQIHILQPERDITIHAYMPENFTSSISSDYDAPFTESAASALADHLPGGLGAATLTAAQAAGFGKTAQGLSMQVWQGSAPMDFSIPIQFLYDTNTNTDIIDPMKALMSLALPRSVGGEVLGSVAEAVGLDSKGDVFLESPGPKIAQGEGTFGGFIESSISIRTKDDIILAIGEFMTFPSVVITNVDSDYEIKLDRAARKPIALNATVAFRTFLTPTAEDLNTIFGSTS